MGLIGAEGYARPRDPGVSASIPDAAARAAEDVEAGPIVKGRHGRGSFGVGPRGEIGRRRRSGESRCRDESEQKLLHVLVLNQYAFGSRDRARGHRFPNPIERTIAGCTQNAVARPTHPSENGVLGILGHRVKNGRKSAQIAPGRPERPSLAGEPRRLAGVDATAY